MGVWGYGIFANDEATDARDKVVQGLEERLYDLVNDHEGSTPTEDEQFALMAMITALVKSCDGFVLIFTREDVKAWKSQFMRLYDETMRDLPIGDEDDDEPYTPNHRAVIVTTFDNFADACMTQKEMAELEVLAGVTEKPARTSALRKRRIHR